MALWYARENGRWDDYVFGTKKIKKFVCEDGSIRFDGDIDVCCNQAELILASPDMRLKPGEGPFRLESLRRWKK